MVNHLEAKLKAKTEEFIKSSLSSAKSNYDKPAFLISLAEKINHFLGSCDIKKNLGSKKIDIC
jgi:hypothetical protein